MVGVVPGLFLALAVGGLGAGYVSQQPVQYSAANQLLLAPQAELSPSSTSSYWETLGNGQLPATAAAIVNDKRILKATTANLSAATRDAISVTVSVLPSTAVINVQVTAPTASVAERVANDISNRSTVEVTEVLAPYRLQVISDAEDTATLASLSHAQWAGLVGLLALFVGLGLQQLLSWRARLVQARRTPVEVPLR